MSLVKSFVFAGIKPDTHSPGMFSWFPILFPLKVSYTVRTPLNVEVESLSDTDGWWTMLLFAHSNPSPCPGTTMSQCDSGAATMGRRFGMNGLWRSPPAPPFTTPQAALTPSACEEDHTADSRVSVTLGGSGRAGVVTLLHTVKTWTCGVSPH